MKQTLVVVGLMVAVCTFSPACSVLSDTDGLANGSCRDCDKTIDRVNPIATGVGADPDSATLPPYNAPSCGGTSHCFPNAPAGWSGPIALVDRNGSASEVPACPSQYADRLYDGFDQLDAPPSACSCTCGNTGSGTGCGPVKLTAYDGDNCKSPCGAAVTIQPNQCVNVYNAVGCSPSSVAVEVQSGSGSCTPNATAPVTAPYGWKRYARACGASAQVDAATCDAGSVCMPSPPAPFAPKLCVMHPGLVACPAGAYGVKHVYYGSANDTRSCGTCTCLANCTGKIVYNDGCGASGDGSFPIGQMCTATHAFDAYRFVPDAQQSGGCTATIAPTGSAAPSDPTTVCCAP